MGDVFLARRVGPHRFSKLVAVKTIRRDLVDRPDVRAMFLDEARLVAKISHPSVTQVMEFGDAGGVLYLVMEYLEGVTLRALQKNEIEIPRAVAVRMIAEACRGMHAAHEARDEGRRWLAAVHRDISPKNLFVTFDGHVKVLDFGIAFMRHRLAPATAIGSLRGTVAYMAPEQLEDGRIDRRTDVYSAALVLYELLTRRRAFAKITPEERLTLAELPAPSQLDPTVPAIVDPVLMRGLAKAPEDRYDSALAFATALEALAPKLGDEQVRDFAERSLGAFRAAHETALDEALGVEAAPGILNARTVSARGHEAVPDTVSVPNDANPVVDTVSAPRGTKPVDDTASAWSDTRPVPVETPPRRIALLISAAALGGVVAYAVAVLPSEAPPPVAPPAALDETAGAPAPPARSEPVEGGRASAEPGPAVTPEDREPPKAPRRVKARRAKARGRPRPPPPAPPPPPPEPAFGTLVVKSFDPYALVRVDGEIIGPTPILEHRLPAGWHEVELLHPVSKEVRLTRRLEISPGGVREIRARGGSQ